MAELHTDRLILREFTLDDITALHALESRPDVARYIWGVPQTLEETSAEVEAFVQQQREEPRQSAGFVIASRTNPALIGRCGLSATQREPGESGLWYSLHPDFWNQGLATEAVSAMLEFGFRELGRRRIWADVDPGNIGSWRVLEKLGLRREAHFVEHTLLAGEWCDSYIYAILDREWPPASTR